MESSNLIELPKDYSHSINPEQVKKGLESLGHVSKKVITPNMSLNPARDLGFYRATEAIFNVMRDNENIQRLSMHSGTAAQNKTADGELRCHGFNSVKDFLSQTQLDTTTAMETEMASPSRFGTALNTHSSGQFTGTVRGSTFGGRHNRPKTGVASNARNSTNLTLFGHNPAGSQ